MAEPTFQNNDAAILERINRLKQSISPEKSQEEQEKDESFSTGEFTIETARRFGEGFSLGWADETGLRLAAAVAAFTPGVEEDFPTIYKKMKEDYDRKKSEFQRQYPKTAITSELVGGILTPVPIGKAKIPSMAVDATQGLRGVTGAIANRGISAANTNIGRAATVGAVYGAGSAEEGERLGGALEGAVLGAGVSAGLQAVGKAAKYAVQKNVNLFDEYGNAVPFHLGTPETRTGAFFQAGYRRFASLAEEQQKPALLAAQARTQTAQEAVDAALENTKRIQKENLAAVQQTQKEAIENLNLGFQGSKSRILNEIATKEGRITSLLKDTKGGAIASNALTQMKEAADRVYSNFRKKAYLEAFPTFGDKSSLPRIERALNEDPRTAVDIIESEWREYGFKPFFNDMKISEKTSLGSVLGTIQSRINADDRLKEAFGVSSVNTPIMTQIRNAFSLEGAPGTPLTAATQVARGLEQAPVISGTAFGAAYSRLGTLARTKTDPNERRAFYTAQNALIDILEENVPKTVFNKFLKERQKWKTLMILREAASNTNFTSKRGAFDANDWITAASGTVSPYQKQRGIAPLLQEAEGIIDTINSSQRPVLNRVRGEMEKRTSLIKKEVKDLNAELTQKTKDYEEQLRVLTNSLPYNPSNTQRIVEAKAALADVQQRLSVAKEAEKILKSRTVQENQNWVARMAPFAALSSLFSTAAGLSTGPLGAVAGPAVAFGFQRGISSPSVQRAAAGQTAIQQAARRQLENKTLESVLSSRLPAVTAGMMTGD